MDQKGFPPEFIDLMEATDPVQLTSQVVHHAAAGMTLLLWRNTPTVETDAHTEGDWDDADILRMNTPASLRCSGKP